MADESTTIETPATSKAETAESKTPDMATVLASLTAKHGSADAALIHIVGENHKARGTIRSLKAKLPPDDAVVITGDDIKAYEAYRSMGKPEDVKKALRDGSSALAENQGFRREKEVAEFGKKAGVPPEKFALLNRLAGSATFAAEKRKIDGKDIEVVTVKDGDADPVDFDVHFKDALESLKPEAKQDRARGTPSRRVVGGDGNNSNTPPPPKRREPSLVR